jgi:glutamyl-tRNA synthetase
MSQPIVRIAPSPTGHAHIGFYRTAIFNYLFAKKNNGKFLLRIEDTDKVRSEQQYTDGIIESLEWLGLAYDSMSIQSENMPIHKAAILKLIEGGKAYVSKEEAKDGSGVIKEIVRFKNPNTKVTYTDLILGETTVDTTDLGDFVIARNIEDPLYHLAVVVDDAESCITHVIRGMDHISNTPRQILLIEALGYTIPQYAHIPLVLGHDKQKLSKRKGALSVLEYKKLGYLPEAVINCASFIGFNPGGEREIYSLNELIEAFDFSRVQKSSAVFNPVKLDWFNSEYIKALSDDEYLTRVKKYFAYQSVSFPNIEEHILNKILLTAQSRINNFSELKTIDTVLDYTLDGILDLIRVPEKTKKDKVVTNLEIKAFLTDIQDILEAAPIENFASPELVKEMIWDYAEEKGRGVVLWPLRIALTNQEKSIDPFSMIWVLGKDTTLERLNQVAGML